MVLAYPCWNFSETALHKVCICESCRNMDCHLVIYGGILRKWNVLFTVCPDRPQRVTQVRQQISYIPNSFQVVRDPELHNALPLQLKQSKLGFTILPSLPLPLISISFCEWREIQFDMWVNISSFLMNIWNELVLYEIQMNIFFIFSSNQRHIYPSN